MSATGLALLLATGMTGMQALQKAPQLTDAVISGITDTPMKTQQKGSAKAATTDVLTVGKKAADEVTDTASGTSVKKVAPEYAKKGTIDTVTGKELGDEELSFTKSLKEQEKKQGKKFDLQSEVDNYRKTVSGADGTIDENMDKFLSDLVKGWGSTYTINNDGILQSIAGDNGVHVESGEGDTRKEDYAPDNDDGNFRDFVNDSQGVSLESKAQQLVFGEATIKADGSYVQDKKSKDGSLEVLYFTDPMYDAGTTLYKIDGLASYLDPETGSTVYRKISNHNNTRFRDKYFQPYDKGTNTWNYNLYNLDKIR